MSDPLVVYYVISFTKFILLDNDTAFKFVFIDAFETHSCHFQKIERNKTGGGVSHARAMTPATQILADLMETSVASSGIPEAIDSNNTSSLELARKRMHLDDDNDDNESTAMLNLDESVDEDNEVVQETPGAVQPSGSGCPPLVPHKSPPKKRTRRDKRKQYHSLQMRNDQQELINSELQLSKARLSLMQWKIAHKKLQVYTLTKGLTPAEVDEAYSLELSSEAQLLNGDF
jgi:hypothetical protein